jgi:hypothetical protein
VYQVPHGECGLHGSQANAIATIAATIDAVFPSTLEKTGTLGPTKATALGVNHNRTMPTGNRIPFGPAPPLTGGAGNDDGRTAFEAKRFADSHATGTGHDIFPPDAFEAPVTPGDFLSGQKNRLENVWN